MSKRFIVPFGLLVAALLAVSFAAADAPIEGRAGRAEVRFLEGMIDHHTMALDMANDCLLHASAEDVLAVCQAVIEAQTPEIELMVGWLLEWYNIEYAPYSMMEMTSDDSMGGMNMGDVPATDPANMMGMMAGLNRLEGVEYDLAWLEAMIDHHDDALHMSERVLTRAEHEELRELAQNIIDAQSAEIEMMEALIVSLSE